jgi:tetratricopeptide (TPR) repeat protein
MTGQDLDTRSDIYSLGAVLYELLAGVLPFDPKTLRTGGVDHIGHVIREEDPKTPSTRLSTILGEKSTKVAQLRHTDVRALGRKLHGDLDWITIKAMDKDRLRRYQTAHALAEDIRRHLDNEPVLAGPPSKIYRLKKLLLKHRTKVITAAAVVILVAAMAIISTMYVQSVNRGKEAESLEHTNILSKAQEYRSNGQFQEALTEVSTILNSEHVGPEAHLLRARLVLELQGPDEALEELQKLLSERDEIACQAHFLLARIYLESDPGDPDTTQLYQKKAREHQQKGEELFSESAEAYFNRAMIAGTVNKTLECLNKAVDLDPGHYPSRKARALAYYAIGDYRNMERDAVVMTSLRNWDALGHSLMAISLREAEYFADAVKYHDKAIEISPDDPGLYDQRRRTHMRMGDYEQALADARVCIRLDPDERFYHFHSFCALVALGRYDEAKVKYNTIIESGVMSEGRLNSSAEKYVADMLDAGLPWHPAERRPNGVAFLAMHESAEISHQLAKKARRVVAEGFHATWSPDGTELAYSRGLVGFSGIEIVNLKNEKTRLLTVPGLDPAWSPDGRHIAFTRDRKILLLTELTAERVSKSPSLEEREVWIIKADGTEEPRLLARGYWPCWSSDSKRVFYHSRPDNMLYSISIEESAKPVPIIQCAVRFPTVSPDGKYVGYPGGASQIVELATNSVVADYAMPLGVRGVFVNWSPDGRELSIGGWNDGLWIYDLDTKTTLKVLSGRFGWCSWSWPDIKQLAIERAYGGHWEIWVASLDSNVSTTEALGPGRTIEEHAQEMVDLYTRRIDEDPEDAGAYGSRMECYVYLQEYEKATADLEEFAILLKSNPRPALPSRVNEFITDLAAVGIEKYGMGAYEQALATLTFVDKLHRVVNSESSPAEVAFIAMSLHQLGRAKEAESTLEELRGMFENDKNSELLKWLCGAEKLFAGESSNVGQVWECIELGKLNNARQLIKELRSLPLQEYTDIAGSIARATKTLAGAYYERGRSANYSGGGYGETISDYEAAVRVDPNYARAFSDLAWLRAACPEADFRDGKKAIENATKACGLTGWKDHRYVGALAAVYAEVGDFDNAVKWQKKATDLLTEDNRAKWQVIYESRLQLYQSDKPCHGGNLWSFSTGRMIGWWKFDEGRGSTALDSSGHGNHGTLQGDPQWVDGIRGGALDLDGSDFVTIDGVVDDITSNNITVSAWIKTTSTEEGNLFASNSGGYHAFLFGIQGGNVYLSDDYTDECLTAIAVNDGQWHMWTYVRRGARGYIYIDAVQESTHSADFDLAAETRWSIGQEWDSSPSDFLTGTVDDARFYTYALTEAEIKALYAGRDPDPSQN